MGDWDEREHKPSDPQTTENESGERVSKRENDCAAAVQHCEERGITVLEIKCSLVKWERQFTGFSFDNHPQQPARLCDYSVVRYGRTFLGQLRNNIDVAIQK